MVGRVFPPTFAAGGGGLRGKVVGGQDAQGDGVVLGEAVAVEAEADFTLGGMGV